MKFARLIVLLAPFAVLSPAALARADTSIEEAIRSWIASIDASPDWHATYASLAADPATGAATLTGLTVTSDKPGFSLSASVKVEGFHPSADPVFTADEIDLTDVKLVAGDYAVSIPDAVVSAPMLPETGGFAWDPAAPMLSAIHALATLTGTAAASVKAPTVALAETIAGVESDTTYQNVSVVGWRNGRIAQTTAGPMKAASPAKTPLATLTAATAETRNIDLGALLAVLDPAHYANGTGDGAWRPVIDHSALHGVKLAVPGVSFTAADVATDGVRVRQAKTPPSYAAEPTDASASLLDHVLHRLEESSNLAFDRFALAGVGGNIPGVVDAHLDALTVSKVADNAIGDFSLSGLAVTLANNGGTVKLATFGLGGLALPSPDAIRKAAAAPETVDYAGLIPPITYVEADGLSVAMPDVANASLDRFRLDLANYVENIPKAITLDLAGVDLPTGLIPSDHARDLFARFGYDRLHLDAAAHINGTAPDAIVVKDFRLAMKDAGAVSGDADLAGSMPTNAAEAKNALASLAIKRGTVTVTDDSLIERLIAAQAMRLKVDPEKFRQQFATGLPFMLMLLNNRDLQAKLTPALQGFIRNGGSLSAVAAPATPVPLSQVVNAATSQPFTLFTLLATSVSGTPGAQPTVIPTLPAVVVSPPAPAARATANDNAADQPDDNGDDQSVDTGRDAGNPPTSGAAPSSPSDTNGAGNETAPSTGN